MRFAFVHNGVDSGHCPRRGGSIPFLDGPVSQWHRIHEKCPGRDAQGQDLATRANRFRRDDALCRRTKIDRDPDQVENWSIIRRPSRKRERVVHVLFDGAKIRDRRSGRQVHQSRIAGCTGRWMLIICTESLGDTYFYNWGSKMIKSFV